MTAAQGRSEPWVGDEPAAAERRVATLSISVWCRRVCLLRGVDSGDAWRTRGRSVAEHRRRAGFGFHPGARSILVVAGDLLDVDQLSVARTVIAHASGVGLRRLAPTEGVPEWSRLLSSFLTRRSSARTSRIWSLATARPSIHGKSSETISLRDPAADDGFYARWSTR